MQRGRPVATGTGTGKRNARGQKTGPRTGKGGRPVQRRHQSCRSVTPSESRCPLAIDVPPVPRRNVNFG